MKALVIGYGSIGSRHVDILKQLECDVAIVSRRPFTDMECFSSISTALRKYMPEYVVLARETSSHQADLIELANNDYAGLVLIEKPIFHKLLQIPENKFKNAFVAYNLRFHPLILKLHDLLEQEKVLSACVYVGQYLPGWRPGRDYRLTSSAIDQLGGGVLRDLSHELDYLLWFFGNWRRVTAIGGHYSHLQTTCDDIYTLLFSADKCPAISVQMNYLDRVGSRIIIINSDTKTFKLDLVNCILKVNDKSETCKIERNDTYISQHKAILNNNSEHLCTLNHGIEVMSLIEAAENAAQSKEWISR